MSLTGLLGPLGRASAYRRTVASMAAGGAHAVVAPDAAKPLVIAGLWRDLRRPLLVLCPHPDDARRLFDQLEAYCGEGAPLLHFAEAEVLPYERLSVEAGTMHERIRALGALRENEGPPPLIIASVTGVLQKTLPPAVLQQTAHAIVRGQRLAVESVLTQWARMGYTTSPLVDHPGTAARRGGIVDVYGPGHDSPVRIDLWGDEIDSIRAFDANSQRSGEHLDSVTMLPAGEALPALADHVRIDELVRSLDFANTGTSERDRIQDELADLLSGLSLDNASFYAGFLLQHTLLDHLPDDIVVIVNEPAEADEAARHVEGGAEKLRLAKEERGVLPMGFPAPLADWDSVSRALESLPCRLELSRYHQAETGGPALTLPFDAAPSYHGGIDALAEAVQAGHRGAVVIATQHSQRLRELLAEADVGAAEERTLDAAPEQPVTVVHTTIAGGWTLSADEGGEPLVTLLSDAEVFGARKQRVTRARRHAQRFQATTVEELTPGAYVVHVDHGVGRFAGTGSRTEDADAPAGREYLILEYAGGDRLYVPMEHLARLSPYAGGEEKPPSLTSLGGQEWTRAVSRARESTKRLAIDLLALYARRESADGFPHGSDTPWQREMEDAFPFVETPDQQRAIDDVKEDMEIARPMDRLVCGDVGYGKTEVALRAAFKAVMSGKQAAVLVPTTVLAQQHHRSFVERLGPFPARVEMLSRFRTSKEQDEVVRGLKSGEVDVVIGTHRLVQKDVDFKDLGIVIIDEEHRFGVAHKERLRELRTEVDVLTLTATPIPRTLHMAMSGIRDISTIETPPEERLPIKTYLAERSDDLVKEAVQRELDRGGQVFFLHNRVKSIHLAAAHLRDLVPEARILIGHGQMPEEELSEIMERFADGEGDVLVCTTIIESGLDIPNVNTLVVDHADRFGLAQLYQLRGRIGRRSQRAYAYLLVERGRRLTDTARRRLETIMAATELGAGFRIAMKDLEIRGAGNLLGGEQSGHIQAVGFDLYTRLLSEAVAELRAMREGGPPPSPPTPDPVIDLGLPASIPEDLVPHMPARMAMYQRLARATTVADVDDLPREFMERFGHRLPDELHNLLFGVRVRVLAKSAGIESVTKRSDRVTLKLVDEAGGARTALERALGHGTTVGNQQVHVPLAQQEMPWGQALLEVLEELAAFRERTGELSALLAQASAR
ncbi:MAG: transcription-repair coupling factor [Chloroflexota bacterium]|nr:transcription-repair coupling factor [Chloroflexota bacterium]